KEWARIPGQSTGEPFGSILRRVRGDIAEVVSAEGLEWNESDTPALAASASLMRYMWIGDVSLAADEENGGGNSEK
ncbi:MAG: hypothetical protein LBU26_04105, partial [Synergistaceae bacterium]|nr:hypothetical protein [Synergistaceae bacterium]